MSGRSRHNVHVEPSARREPLGCPAKQSERRIRNRVPNKSCKTFPAQAPDRYHPEHSPPNSPCRFDASIQFMQPRRLSPRRKAKPAGVRRIARQRSPELVLITGMSGSGKASVLKAFEDLGYYCVDNLPVELIPQFAELAVQSSEIRRTALVVDVREGAKFEKLPAILKSVRRMIPTKVVFLEASDAVLLRRFSETRRPIRWEPIRR